MERLPEGWLRGALGQEKWAQVEICQGERLQVECPREVQDQLEWAQEKVQEESSLGTSTYQPTRFSPPPTHQGIIIPESTIRTVSKTVRL